VLLLGYLALRRRRAAAVMLAVMVALGVVSSIVEGPAVWRRWAAAAPAEVAAWQTWVANTASLHGLLARLLAGGPFARPWLEAPALARALTAAASLVLVGTALAVTARAPATPEQERRLFAVWCLLVVLLNPLGWTHTLVIALVAAALLAPDGAPLAAAVIVWTVPRETLERLAGPLPVGAVGGLVLGAHAVATGALVVAAALSGRAAGSAIPSRS
jgi:hypothetical protein